MRTRGRLSRLAIPLGALFVLALVAGNAGAASIGIDPTVRSCTTVSCDPITVQVTLLVTELDADGFEFSLDVTNASLVGWAPSSSVGSGAASMTGGVVLQADGVTLLGSFISNPVSFDGPQTFDVAILDLAPIGIGTTELDFNSAEISCSTCNAGAGQIYTNTNLPGQLLGQINVVPEPGSFGLLALGLLGLSARSRGGAR